LIDERTHIGALSATLNIDCEHSSPVRRTDEGVKQKMQRRVARATVKKEEVIEEVLN
jgi:hypothetical protein